MGERRARREGGAEGEGGASEKGGDHLLESQAAGESRGAPSTRSRNGNDELLMHIKRTSVRLAALASPP